MLTTKQLRELISKHNKLSKITIPARATRPQLIKLIEGQGYKIFEEQGKIVGGPKRIIKPTTPSKKAEPEKKPAPAKKPSQAKKADGRKPPPKLKGLEWKKTDDNADGWAWYSNSVTQIEDPKEKTRYEYKHFPQDSRKIYQDGFIADDEGNDYTIPEFKRKYNKLLKSSDFKMSARDRRDLIFQWELWWRRNGGLGLKDYVIMPTRIANAAFKNQKDIDDKKRREGIFKKLQQLIGDGNMSDGTTWKTITKKDIEEKLE
jgi:hypothetical protein